MFVFDIRILTTPLVSSNSSFHHCVVSSSSIYGFWLPLWCLQTLLLTIVLSLRLRNTDSDSPFGVFKLFFWPLCCLFVFDIKILTTPVVSSNSSFDHCVVCSSSIYGFWLPLWCLQTLLLTIVLSVRLRFKDSDYPFGVFKLFFWPLCCVRLRYTDSNYPVGVFKLFFSPLCCLFVFDIRILTTPVVSSNTSFDHCVVSSSSIYDSDYPFGVFKLLLTIVLSVRLRYKDSDYPCGVFKHFFWPLCCLFVFDIKILTTPLVSSNSSFDHCVVCSSSIYVSDYPCGVFKLFFSPLCCLFIFDIRILTTPLVSSNSSFDHCVVGSSSM